MIVVCSQRECDEWEMPWVDLLRSAAGHFAIFLVHVDATSSFSAVDEKQCISVGFHMSAEMIKRVVFVYVLHQPVGSGRRTGRFYCCIATHISHEVFFRSGVNIWCRKNAE